MSGCERYKYDYSNWITYELPNYHTFQYPDNWKKELTEDGSVYFYEEDNYDKKNIIAFQSRSYSSYSDEGFEGITESNAYSENFKSINIEYYAGGVIPNVGYGTDKVSVNGIEKKMNYIYLQSQNLDEDYDFKIYFTDDVDIDTFMQIYNSCE